MTIKTDVKELEKNKVELTIDVGADRFKKSIGKAYRSISKKAKIPGFRAGKIPARVIDNYFGQAYVFQQAIEQDLPGFYSQAVIENDLKPIDRPNIEIISTNKDKNLKFKAQVEVEPLVKLPAYKEIKVEYKKSKVKKEDVDARINVIRDKFAELKPVKGKVSGEGDYVIINFDGKIDGKPFEGGSAKDFSLELGSKTFMEEFENELIGTKEGDIKKISLKLPEQVPNKAIAGKVANFDVLVKEVKVKNIPELTDKFVKEVVGYDSVEDLKNKIKENLQKELDKHSEEQYQIALIKEFADKAKVDIPKKMIDAEIENMLSNFEFSLKNQGTNLDEYLTTQKITKEKIKEDLVESAKEKVRQELVLTNFIDKEKIKITDEELETAIEDLNKDKEKPVTREELEKKNLIQHFKSRLVYNKAMETLRKKVKQEAK